MSRTLRAPGGAWRIALLGALALAAAVLAALTSSPPSAEAAFTTAQCQGADTSGRGASFARDAHQVFRLQFQTGFCGGTAPAVGYEALGSGAGRRVVGERTSGTGTEPNTTGANSRNQPPRFGMTDEPVNESTGKPQIIGGTDAPGDESPIHQIPAAVGAVPVLVNFPNDCDVNLLPDASKTDEQNLDGDSTPDDVVRVRFSKTQLEKIFAKDDDSDNWTEVFPSLTPDADCNKPIIRVVRFDDSGTTFTLKDYLNRILPSRRWIPDFTAPAGSTAATRQWPNATFGPRTDCPPTGTPPAAPSGPGSQDDATDQLTSGCASGNGSLVSKLIGTDGSIGYSDISTARTAGLAITPEAAAPGDNDTYWTQAQNGAGGNNAQGPLAGNQFTEPTADDNGFRTDGLTGSRCATTTFTGVPESTLGDWTNASGVNSPAGFGICTLTYGLLFDDYKKAYALQPDQAGEERKARTVKDYWTAIVSDGGQAVLFGKDYSPLPASVLAISRAGVNAVGFDKAATGGGGTPPVVNPPVVNPPGTTTPPPVVPSNRFTIVRTTLRSRQGTGQFTVRVPGRGTLTLSAKAKSGRKRINVDAVRLTVSRSGTYRLNLKPGKAAKRILKKRGKLRVSVRITFTPRGGTLRAINRTVTLRLTRKVRR